MPKGTFAAGSMTTMAVLAIANALVFAASPIPATAAVGPGVEMVPLPAVERLPYDAGSGPQDRNVPFLAWPRDLGEVGYAEQELLLSGSANTYAFVDAAAQTNDVQVATSEHPYTTRILVRQPSDRQRFNGVVYLELLNPTAGYDGSFMWNATFNSVIADGAAWVGITYSEQTAGFMKNFWGLDRFPAPAGAEHRDRSRYATLNVTRRAYVWDMVAQAAALLKADEAADNPLQGYAVDTIILSGYSQSARYVTTFANSFYQRFLASEGVPVVDGFLLAAGGPLGSQLNGVGLIGDGDPRSFAAALAPTVRITTESDYAAVLARESQLDKPLLRTYEIAGSSHLDEQSSLIGAELSEYHFGVIADGVTVAASVGCDLPLNPIRTGAPIGAIQHRLAQWIQRGVSPPDNRLLEYDEVAGDWRRDADGNALGGVRPARIAVPLGRYSGVNTFSGPSPSVESVLCGGFVGAFDAFTEAELAARYRSRRLFLMLNWRALIRQYIDGFLLPVDAVAIWQDARAVEGLPPVNPRGPGDRGRSGRNRGGVR